MVKTSLFFGIDARSGQTAGKQILHRAPQGRKDHERCDARALPGIDAIYQSNGARIQVALSPHEPMSDL